jgi:DNA-directed RNA polymerase subunit RPC12/RpoP
MLRETKCPRCGSDGTVRSHRTVLERLFVGFKPVRCLGCQHRFFVLSKFTMPRRLL